MHLFISTTSVACLLLLPTGTANFIRPLMLDLNTLPREEGPPSESVLKRQKFAVFEKHCSQVRTRASWGGQAQHKHTVLSPSTPAAELGTNSCHRTQRAAVL
jgi:hypothetical protein